MNRKANIYYKHLIIAIYLSAIEMLSRGVMRQIGLEGVVIGVTQGWIYLLPLLMRVLYPLPTNQQMSGNFYNLVMIQIIYVALAVAPQNLTNGTYVLLANGIKNFYLPLLTYFGIFAYLAQHPDFERRFLSHIIRIGLIAGGFIVVEVMLLSVSGGVVFLTYLRHISTNFQESSLDTIRPLGLFLGHHMSALFFALLAVLCNHAKRKILGFSPKVLFCFFVLCLIFTTTKTFIAAFFVYYCLTVILSFNVTRWARGLMVAALFTVILPIVNPSIVSELSHHLRDDTKSKSRMLDKADEFSWFLEHSIIPNGFLPEGLGEKEGVRVDPIYEDSEIYAYKLAYRIGIIGFILYFITVFRPLLTLHFRHIVLHPYRATFFVCAFGFLHYLPMFGLYNFSILIFCYTMLYKKQTPVLVTKRAV